MLRMAIISSRLVLWYPPASAMHCWKFCSLIVLVLMLIAMMMAMVHATSSAVEMMMVRFMPMLVSLVLWSWLVGGCW